MCIVLDDKENENVEDPHSIETDESDQEDGNYYYLHLRSQTILCKQIICSITLINLHLLCDG